ncbi:MAG TPA: hypothetical protein VJH03_03470 [Blastocatellia bacterium]|nr:hypothetical protein [Blastocatellia bacterium]
MAKKLTITMLGAVLILSAGLFTSFGQETNRTIVLSRQARLAGSVLTQGRYSVSFDEKKSGDLSLAKDGKQVVKAPYKLVALSKEAPDTAVVFAAASDGSLQVRRIELKGLKVALQIE